MGGLVRLFMFSGCIVNLCHIHTCACCQSTEQLTANLCAMRVVATGRVADSDISRFDSADFKALRLCIKVEMVKSRFECFLDSQQIAASDAFASVGDRVSWRSVWA